MKKVVYIVMTILIVGIIVFFVWNNINSTEELTNSKKTITDMIGNTVKIDKNIERVACQSSTCEAAIISLGKAEVLVGTTDYTDEESFAYDLYGKLKQVQNLTDDMSVEEMLEKNVQLVIVKDTNKIDKYKTAGLPVVCLDFDTVDGTKPSIKILGDILGQEERAENCVNYIERCERIVTERIKESGVDEFTAYYARAKYEDSDITTTYAAGHIYSEWIGMSNGKVITADMDLKETKGGVHINGEELILANPDHIFVGGYYRNDVLESAKKGKYSNVLEALENDSAHIVPTSVTDWSVGCCELGLVILWCAKTVYPDLFEDIDMVNEVKTFYKDVSGITVSDELAEKILTSTR